MSTDSNVLKVEMLSHGTTITERIDYILRNNVII